MNHMVIKEIHGRNINVPGKPAAEMQKVHQCSTWPMLAMVRTWNCLSYHDLGETNVTPLPSLEGKVGAGSLYAGKGLDSD